MFLMGWIRGVVWNWTVGREVGTNWCSTALGPRRRSRLCRTRSNGCKAHQDRLSVKHKRKQINLGGSGDFRRKARHTHRINKSPRAFGDDGLGPISLSFYVRYWRLTSGVSWACHNLSLPKGANDLHDKQLQFL
jgi:hypothetical protein